VVSLIYCKTDYKIAYIFTKPLTKAKFVKLRTLLGFQEAIITSEFIKQEISAIIAI